MGPAAGTRHLFGGLTTKKMISAIARLSPTAAVMAAQILEDANGMLIRNNSIPKKSQKTLVIILTSFLYITTKQIKSQIFCGGAYLLSGKFI